MASQTEIVNYALGKLGAETRLSSLEEDNKAARAARAVWAIARDFVLAAHPWNFAMGRAQLPALVAPPLWGYERQFQKPADMVRLIEVNGARVWNLTPGADAPYSYEGDKILTNLGAPLRIRYVRRIEDTAAFSPGFVEALASKLAIELAFPMTDDKGHADRMEARWEVELARAAGVDGRENPPELPDEDDWILARELA